MADLSYSDKVLQVLDTAIDDLLAITKIAGYAISLISGYMTYQEDINTGKPEAEALGHAFFTELTPLVVGGIAGTMVSGVTAVLIGVGAGLVSNVIYDNNFFGIQEKINDCISKIIDLIY